MNDPAHTEVSAIDALAGMGAPYTSVSSADEELFTRAMLECDNWHRQRNANYQRLWSAQSRPMTPVGLFKRTDLGTPLDAPGNWLESSGTGSSGKTRVFFDEPSLARIKRAMFQMFLLNRFVDMAPANFLLLSPSPDDAGALGYATAFEKFTACAPVKERVYAVSASGSFEPERAWQALQRWSQEKSPIFIFGLTVFFERLVLAGAAPLAPLGTVKALTGGGWKGMEKQLSRPETVARLQELLPAPVCEVRDLYGMTEHPLHYLSCALGRFHIPKYSRFSILDSVGEDLPAGQSGLIRLRNPFFAALPSHDLLTEDLGQWGQGCACECPLPFIEFMGRVSEATGTCAHSASQGGDLL